MLVATKRAVGSEYEYRMPVFKEDDKKKARVRIRRNNSPLAGIVCGLLLIALLFSTGLSYTYLKAYKARVFWGITQMQQTNKAIQNQNAKLELEAARLKSLDRIASIAATQMGMTPTTDVQYLVLEVGTAELPHPAVQQSAVLAQENGGETSLGRKLLEGIVTMIKERGLVLKG